MYLFQVSLLFDNLLIMLLTGEVLIYSLKTGSEKPDFPAITAFESNSVKIAFSFTKLPGRQHDTQIKATFTNKSSNEYTDFIFQAAVPKVLEIVIVLREALLTSFFSR